ncbi:hypothetical protein [Candidatus Chazhemtobacterium aquaticus]|uniref:Uncharacterized protein n=1 Tax=Candidatus Chazhemtobacterium aquaticus TaxID=2715735 RepID=A0A857N826_9BACT|nr:hypothetical protein [Candidatus Chazhemtobacterium aquaticus]QHO63509.1 hypothetical protein MICH65_0528 [Candidatus Chazhemtobacterium aquaticus]
MALTQTDITKLSKIFATKEDLRKALAPYATKEDLRKALAPYATKEDLEKYLTVDEFRQFKDDVLTGLDKVMGELKKIREEQIFMHNKVYQDHEKRITRLEQTQSLA